MSIPNLHVTVIGANGYTGQELITWLRRHPAVGRLSLASRQEAGQSVPSLWQQTSPHIDKNYFAPTDPTLKKSSVVFFATPHGTALSAAPEFLAAGCKVIDLSADFRLREAAVFQQWYGLAHHQPSWQKKAVYGLTEINRAHIAGAELIANPGCYASAVQLGLIPLLREGLITSPLIADVKSGVSGAGKKLEADLLFHEVNENFRPYAVAGHRHHPEIVQELTSACSATTEPQQAIDLIFTPHLVPMQRGILASLHAHKTAKITAQSVRQAFVLAYRECPFIYLCDDGQIPSTAEVAHTNMVSIGWTLRPESALLSVFVVLDNMVKGASGAAIQNMNVMLGMPETMGLI